MTVLPAGDEEQPGDGTFAAGRRPARVLSPRASGPAPLPAITSGLPVDELVLSRQAGVIPLASVMGYSAFRVGRGTVPSGRYAAMKLESHALDRVRALALERLTGEARRAAADAVVGIKIAGFPAVWSKDTLEMRLTGTAVALRGRPVTRSLLLTNLSIQDLWKLREAGYVPAGLVAASIVSYASAWDEMARNRELGPLTKGLQGARASVLWQVERQARALGAEGLVALDVEQRREEAPAGGGKRKRTGLVFTIHMVGTAIVTAGECKIPSRPSASLDLRDGHVLPPKGWGRRLAPPPRF